MTGKDTNSEQSLLGDAIAWLKNWWKEDSYENAVSRHWRAQGDSEEKINEGLRSAEGANQVTNTILLFGSASLLKRGGGSTTWPTVRNGDLIAVGENSIVKKGDFVNRVFDSRYGQSGANVSGPLGRSFSPGSGVPTTATEAIEQRGLNMFYPNNAREAIIYRAKRDIPVLQRDSIGGTKPEVLIGPKYWDQLEPFRRFSLPE